MLNKSNKFLQTSRRRIERGGRCLLMGILNVTPDSFSDGGRFASLENAIERAAEMAAQGADIIDVGGESTRPGSARVSAGVEIERVVPVITSIRRKLDIPISIDTSKAEVAAAALAAGAEIINDISGLRFDPAIAEVAATYESGLILMHSRGEFQTLHSQPPAADIQADVIADFRRSTAEAESRGVGAEHIALDIGIGFGKTLEQNLELLAKLDKLVIEFDRFPLMVGTSRKSFLGKVLDDAAANERLIGSLTSVAIAAWNGAAIARVHDVKETVEALKVVAALKAQIR